VTEVRLAIGWLNAHGFPVYGEVWNSYEAMRERIASGAANEYLAGFGLQITSVSRLNATSFPVDYARNEICATALASPATHLLFIDLDHLYEPTLAERLLAHQKPVITARYHMRKPPHHAAVYVKHRTLDGPHTYAPVHFGKGVFEIERGGAGALLIERGVLQAIKDRIGHNWFRYQRGPEPPHDYSVSEDFWFYQVSREAGFTCWCDWDTEAKHLQTMAIDGSWNRAYLQAEIDGLRRKDAAAKAAVLGNFVACGYPAGLTLETGDHVPAYTYTPGER
jgi:hypothetical protein